MTNDAMRHRLSEVMAAVEEQLADITAVREKQAKLTATGAAADGMVEVTVDVQGRLIKTAIDESYLEDHEFDELSGHITDAAQAAAREAERRVTALMVPISERRKALPGLSEIVEGAPDLRELLPRWLDPIADAPPPHSADDGAETAFPTVRR